MTMQATVLIVDDHPVFRRGVRLLLEEEEDFRVVGEAGDGHEAMDLARKLTPDLVLMDVAMPNLDGIEATRGILSEFPKMRVIALSVHGEKRFVARMLRAGAAGYVLKDFVPEELVDAVRAVLRGELYLSASITGIVVSQYADVLSRVQASGGLARLTKAEQELIELIAEGRSVEQIAPRLEVDEPIVWSMRRRVVEKLDLTSVAELTDYAGARKWFTEPGGIEEALRQARDSGEATRVPFARRFTTKGSNTLGTKLRAPPVTADRVTRTALLERLEQRREFPLTVVSAPAGYGKSTLVSQWTESLAMPSTWVSLDEDDNAPRRFMDILTAGVDRIFPGAVLGTQSLLSAPVLPPIPVLCDQFLSDLAENDSAFLLVLDDYHRIDAESVHELVSGILEKAPRTMHVALLSRTDPPLPLARFRERGQVDEFSGAELRFTREETAAFLHNTLGESLNEDAVASIDEKIEGWVAGLRLVVSAMGKDKNPDHLLAELKAPGGSVSDYLISEVLSRQPRNIADSLCKTAILDRFCPPLCDALRGPDPETETGGMDGAVLVQWLQGRNLFLIPLDDEGYWFRFHHLFQEMLQRQLERSHSRDEIAALHSRASEWFADKNLIDEALQHALAADDVQGAIQLVEENREATFEDEKWYLFDKWLALFPEATIQQRPGLLMARAWKLYNHMSIADIPPVIDTVEALIGDASTEQTIRAEIDFFRGYICFFSNEGQRSLEHLRDALKRVPETSVGIRSDIEIVYALAMQMQGREERAIHELNEWLDHHPPPQILRRTRLLLALVFVHIISGELDEALAANRQLLDVSKEGGYLLVGTWSLYLKGLLHFCRNELDNAVDYFSEAFENRYVLHRRAAVDSIAALAFIYQSKRQSERADEALQRLFEYVASLNDENYSMFADSCRARVLIMRGETKSAADRLRGASPVENMIWWIEIPAITDCRALLAEGSVPGLREAEERLREYIEMNEAHHNTFQLIGLLALQAMTFDKQGKTEDARSALERALALARPSAFVFPFLELGQPMADLLKRLARREDTPGFVETLLATFSSRVAGRSGRKAATYGDQDSCCGRPSAISRRAESTPRNEG